MMAVSSPASTDCSSPLLINSPPAAICIKKENMLQVVPMDEHKNDDQQDKDVHVYPLNRPSNLCATLDTRELWKQFDALGTEMIVTRRGRRMFPPIKVELHNLNPNSFYVLLMDLAPVDKFRYKYQNSKWVKCFEEACAPTRLYIHPESPALGSYWMDHIVSFYKLKLTNNQLDKQGHIIVNSMHSYQPRLHIVESSDRHNLNLEDFHTITFPGTQFTTVTAYQNDKITQLKIENNPFAKGFRQPMSRNRSRPIKYSYPTQSGSEAGSDDGTVCIDNNSTSTVQSDTHITHEYRHRMSLKRSSSGSDDEVCITKRINYHNEGLVQVTPQINPFLPPQAVTTTTTTTTPPPTQLPTPVYIVYTNNGGSSPPPTTSTLTQTNTSLYAPPQHNPAITTSPASMPAFHIVQIPPPTTTTSLPGQNGMLSSSSSPLLLSKKPSYDSNRSSSESSDSDSDCEQLSPRMSPRTTIIQPPPLIHGTGASFITMPTPQQHHNLIVHSPASQGFFNNGGQQQGIINNTTCHGNGILQTPTQQILVPVTALSQIHGKSNVLLQPLITTAQPGSNGIIQYTTNPSGSQHILNSTTEPGSNRSAYIQTLPVVVSGTKQVGNFTTKPLIPNGTNPGQTFQLLTLPGRTGTIPPHHIVDQAH